MLTFSGNTAWCSTCNAYTGRGPGTDARCPKCTLPQFIPCEGIPVGGALLIGANGTWAALLPDGRVVGGRK